MDHLDRIFRLHRVLSSRRTPIGIQSLRDELDCSRATIYRDIAFLRDRLGAPLESSPRGHYYDRAIHDSYELPGLWFTSTELQALIAVQSLLESLGSNFIADSLAPVKERVSKLLSSRAAGISNPMERIRIIGVGNRDPGEHFSTCANALLNRQQLEITYFTRSRNSQRDREVSPQRLIRYRDNWYLDAWCHDAGALRTFALDCVLRAEMSRGRAKEVANRTLDRELGSSYGIFSGKPKDIAVLRFTADDARWVSRERWHPDQRGKLLEDGSYELRVPYSNATELVMDILRHGPDVEVVSPEALRDVVRQKLSASLRRYD